MRRIHSFFSAVAAAAVASAASPPPPNFVVMLVDDWGWGDLGANDASTKETAHMDALAASGIRFTDFHAMSVCTPSRAALLVGRLAPRSGVFQNFWTDATGGLPQGEITIASLLKRAPIPYDTKHQGKYHNGHAPGFHPTYRGFDEYLGVPYSIDMGCVDVSCQNLPMEAPCPQNSSGKPKPPPDTGTPALPLYNSTGPNCTGHASCNADIAQQPVDLTSLADVYAEGADEFISRHGAGGSRAGIPFFLYMAFSHVHVPLAHAAKWTNSSARNTVFGDTLMELDDTVGRIIASLDAAGVRNNTLVFLTGDNGPWEAKCDLAGSKGPWLGAYQAQLGGGSTGKFCTWEGGHREPGIVSWPSRISPGRVSHATASTLDIYPTMARLAGVPLPSDRVYDGVDLSPVLFGDVDSVREFLFHPDTQTGNLTAVRYKNYTALFSTWGAPDCGKPASKVLEHNPPLIFDLGVDPGQTTPLPSNPSLEALFITALQAKLANISATYRNKADYSQKIGTEPCCNAANVVCRCEEK